MKNIFLLLILLFGAGQLVGQNYYVAIIHGKVSYNGKPLKLKSKITESGELRFSTKDDYIKVSGPKGIYKLTPHKQVPGGSEFFTALSEEVFPKMMLRGSFAHSFSYDPSAPFFFSFPTVIWEGTKIPLSAVLSKRSDDLVLVFQKESGEVICLPAIIEKGNWIIRSADFPADLNPYGEVVLVEDATAWAHSVNTASGIRELDLYSHSLLQPLDPNSGEDGEENAKMLEGYRPPGLSGILLGDIYVGDIVLKKPVFQDARQQVKWMQPSSAKDLFQNLGLADHYEEVFGMTSIPSDLYEYVDKLIDKQR